MCQRLIVEKGGEPKGGKKKGWEGEGRRHGGSGSYSSRFQSQLFLVKSAWAWKKRFNRFATMKGPKLDPPGDHFWFQGGPLSDPFLKTFPLHGGPKLDPQQVESGASLEVRFSAHPSTFFSCAVPMRSASASHKNTALAIRASNKGGPNSVSKNHINFRRQRRTQKLAPCTCFSWSWQSFPSVMLMKDLLFPKPAIDAVRGLARPGQGHASDAKRIGTRTKRASRGLETI